MHGRRDTLVGASKLIVTLDDLPHTAGGYMTATGIQSGPVGSCNIQSSTKVVYCLMHPELKAVENMGTEVLGKAHSIASRHGLELHSARIMHQSQARSGRRLLIVCAELVVIKA